MLIGACARVGCGMVTCGARRAAVHISYYIYTSFFIYYIYTYIYTYISEPAHTAALCGRKRRRQDRDRGDARGGKSGHLCAR
jgi:hypothetical protein